MTRARRWWIAGVAPALLVVVTLGAVVLYRWQLPRVREQLVSILSEQLGARVELAELDVVLGREVQVVGRGLVLHHKIAGQGRPPLVRIAHFTIAVPVLAILRKPIHVNSVTLDRLEIFLPKRRPGQAPDADHAGVRSRGVRAPSRPARPVAGRDRHAAVDRRDAGDRVEQARSAAAHVRDPRPGAHRRGLRPAGPLHRAAHQSQADGPDHRHRAVRSLGGRPAVGEPDQRLVRVRARRPGHHQGHRRHAGVEGRLRRRARSDRRQGHARRRRTSAWTSAGRPCRCRRRLSRWWTAPTATRSCTTSTRGSPARPSRRKAASSTRPAGRAAPSSLQATIDKGQLPDVLRLALDDKEPFMNGLLSLRVAAQPAARVTAVSSIAWSSTASSPSSSCDLPATPSRTRWTTSAAAAGGARTDVTIQNVASTMRGGFRLKDGVLRFSGLRFGVRGALVQLNGYYVLRGGALDFRGSVRLDARASQTMTGLEVAGGQGRRPAAGQGWGWHRVAHQDHRHGQAAEVRRGSEENLLRRCACGRPS